ncbi:MAG: cyclic nucleotide-binding domain-containing protein [Pseudomonadota bacterium]
MPAPKLAPHIRDLKEKAEQAFATQKWAKALTLYLKLGQELSNDPSVLKRIGDLHRRFGEKAEAVEALKKVAVLYAGQGFWAKAIALNKMILEMDPGDISIQRKLAQMMAARTETASRTDPEFRSPTTSEILETTIESVSPSISETEPEGSVEPAQSWMMGNLVEFEEHDLAEKIEVGESGDWKADHARTLGTPRTGLKNVPLFSDMTVEEFHAFLDRLTIRWCPPGTLVCGEGDPGRSMFIVADGELEVFTRDADGARVFLARLRGGDFFGEFGLLTNERRNASVEARTDAELLEITSADLEAIAGRHPRIRSILHEYLRQRILNNILAKSPVFRVLTPTERSNLIAVLRPRDAGAGETIIVQGSEGEEMYFIKTGSVSVLMTPATGERIVVGELGPGDYFGEVAMLTGKPRMATVRAASDCALFELKRKEAAQVLRGSREVLQRLRAKIDERTQDTIEAYRSYLESRETLDLV